MTRVARTRSRACATCTRAARSGRRAGADEREQGAVLVIFAIAMVVLVGITALAIDGSFGFVRNRRAQNAADFAAFAASQQLLTSEYCSGTDQPSTGVIWSLCPLANNIRTLVADDPV